MGDLSSSIVLDSDPNKGYIAPASVYCNVFVCVVSSVCVCVCVCDGSDGSVEFIDSLGTINFASANAVDLNNDGRDEGYFLLYILIMDILIVEFNQLIL